MYLMDIFSCLWCVHFIHGAALLTVVQPSLPCYEWTGVGSWPAHCTVHNISSV